MLQVNFISKSKQELLYQQALEYNKNYSDTLIYLVITGLTLNHLSKHQIEAIQETITISAIPLTSRRSEPQWNIGMKGTPCKSRLNHLIILSLSRNICKSFRCFDVMNWIIYSTGALYFDCRSPGWKQSKENKITEGLSTSEA